MDIMDMSICNQLTWTCPSCIQDMSIELVISMVSKMHIWTCPQARGITNWFGRIHGLVDMKLDMSSGLWTCSKLCPEALGHVHGYIQRALDMSTVISRGPLDMSKVMSRDPWTCP